MKEGIHPTYREVCFVDLSNGFKFVTRSCATSRETVKMEDGRGSGRHGSRNRRDRAGRRAAGPRRERTGRAIAQRALSPGALPAPGIA